MHQAEGITCAQACGSQGHVSYPVDQASLFRLQNFRTAHAFCLEFPSQPRPVTSHPLHLSSEGTPLHPDSPPPKTLPSILSS